MEVILNNRKTQEIKTTIENNSKKLKYNDLFTKKPYIMK